MTDSPLSTDSTGSTGSTEFADCGDIRLAYQSFGSPSDPTIVLIMGLNGQLILWPEPLCRMLAGHGFRVVRFDNRDVGLSTHLSGPALSPIKVWFGSPPAYRLTDLAGDTLRLIEQLAPGGVHLVGISMGGMIAQTATVLRPDLVRSLTSISSTTGAPRVGKPTVDMVIKTLTMRPVARREQRIEQSLRILRRISSPAYPFDEVGARTMAGAAYDRSYDPAGGQRQLAAVLSAPDRTAALSRLALPALVLHGNADPLIDISGGVATARAIPDARLITFPGVGHDLPAPLWERYAAEIATVARQGEQVPAAS